MELCSRYSQLTLPGQRAVLPPIYCSYLPSFLCFNIDTLRLQSMRILKSSPGTDRATDVMHMGITVMVWGWLTAHPFVGKWLFGVASHAGSTEFMYFYCKSLCILTVVYVFLLFFHVFLLLSMYTYCCLRILRRGYPDWSFSVLFPRL